ncbi:LOW QUALITY PROTEIN: hypothetical protein HZS_3039, partial [Henneguya salminicola]
CLGLAFVQENNAIWAYRAFEKHTCFNGLNINSENFCIITRTLLFGDIIVQDALSHYFQFDYRIHQKELNMELTHNNVKDWHNAIARGIGENYLNILKFVASLKRELSLINVKI